MTASRDRLKNFAEVCDFLTVLVAARTARGTCAACGGCGFARNAAAPAFDVFFCLQVTNFDVSLLHSAPNGPDHIHIVIFVLCLHGRNYFVATFALGCPTDPINANIFSALPLLEIAPRARASRSRCPFHRKRESRPSCDRLKNYA